MAQTQNTRNVTSILKIVESFGFLRAERVPISDPDFALVRILSRYHGLCPLSSQSSQKWFVSKEPSANIVRISTYVRAKCLFTM